ncbi:MAG: GAF domain-containing sensor histidine kinase [Anaerolineales bacterium]|nr:GAF domain-containing sensor histidine kinase [Anaerolineales bacterium]
MPPERNLCQQYQSPTRMIGYPLGARQYIIGSLVLARRSVIETALEPTELALMAGIAQQLGLSVENALLRQEVETREHMLGDLLRQVVTAQEDERQRIARELHDATGQSLTAIGLGLRGIENVLARQPECAPLEIADQMRELRTFSQNALGELRHIITDLRPPQLDELGLFAALRWYVTEYGRRRTIETRLFATGDDTLLPAEYKTVLFRIAQESLTNIAKHAEATTADIILNIQPDQVVLDIRDDGRGFDLQQVSERQLAHPGGWGLVGIRERALSLGGRYEIDTSLGNGVHLHVSVPLNNSSDLSDH